MSPAIKGAAEGDLHNPALGAALCGIKQSRFLIHVKEDVLDNIFGFPTISESPQGDTKNQTGISLEEGVKRTAITGFQTSHQLFIARMRPRRKLRRTRMLSSSAPNQRKSENTSIVGRAHPGTRVDWGL